MREALGDGYVDALRSTLADIPETADFVMYWWSAGAARVATGATFRAGFITTNSIVQPFNRAVIAASRSAGAEVIWVIRDHPWVEDADGAAVRVTLTVLGPSRATASAIVVSVDEEGATIHERMVPRLNDDLTSTADVSTASRMHLLASEGLSSPGVKLHGPGFIVPADEAAEILTTNPTHAAVVRPYVNARDVLQNSRQAYVIDFGLRSEAAAREFPVAFDIVRNRVMPDRSANPRSAYRENWWRFGEPRSELRASIAGLSRFIVTPVTAKHRVFMFIPGEIVADDALIAIATAEAHHLGVLSSHIHACWAGASGTTLEDRPRYIKTRCFDPFPFPDPSAALRETIGSLAEKLDQHRKDAIARDERVTMTKMYNVVEKLRSGEALTTKERAMHEVAACGILKDMHDELDALVAEAYGWPWPMEREEILERLVVLHGERVAEEARGQIRWLRPEYQIPRFAPDHVPARLDLPEAVAGPAPIAWPATAVDQLGALKALVERGSVSVAEAVAGFVGADPRLVERHLETLAMLGEVREDGGRFGG
jgi:hypothetical protein